MGRHGGRPGLPFSAFQIAGIAKRQAGPRTKPTRDKIHLLRCHRVLESHADNVGRVDQKTAGHPNQAESDVQTGLNWILWVFPRHSS
jgi:hypothetical protein